MEIDLTWFKFWLIVHFIYSSKLIVNMSIVQEDSIAIFHQTTILLLYIL